MKVSAATPCQWSSASGDQSLRRRFTCLPSAVKASSKIKADQMALM
jgi:hypothetical protein